MDILKSTWNLQRKVEEKTKRIGRGKYGRVLKMARKPDQEEFVKVIQITGIGIVLIGALGFVIYLLWVYLPPILQDMLGI